MSTRNKGFVNGGFYHVYNRGVEKREIFLGESDYFRFIHDIYEFNDLKGAPTNNRGTTSIVKELI